ncbi:DUF4357 domain-containing protein [Solirubrum puertoriconensis]|uniref:RAMA domain-containing protein n=1 Tax=Solirubrum puertoriconensis TaxID=1751427 RepID=A0A9X0HJV1_SOLP1|nr:DUF4357 domain-containing protein [Solirubrum puertoriconensis]KUG07212.1 hypothetical protein ASU33_12625 [Solirubrum puertoriconensis]
MLIFATRKYLKTPFKNEAELEQVVINNYEYLFGPDSFYLPKTKIRTADGLGTIPDVFAIDIGQRKWYIVEAELGHHDVWNHIAKQVSKQIVASQQTSTKRILEDAAVKLYSDVNSQTKEKFDNLNINSVDVRKIVSEILNQDPVIGIPIDFIPNDLSDWARQQKLKLKLWTLSKFVELGDPNNIIYEFPEEFKPTIDIEEEEKYKTLSGSLSKNNIEIFDLIAAGYIQPFDKLFMTYKPKNGSQNKYEAVIQDDGSLAVLGQVFTSPSYAALAGIKNAGSNRQTVNGWTAWKTINGELIADLRDKLLSTHLKAI